MFQEMITKYVIIIISYELITLDIVKEKIVDVLLDKILYIIIGGFMYLIGFIIKSMFSCCWKDKKQEKENTKKIVKKRKKRED